MSVIYFEKVSLFISYTVSASILARGISLSASILSRGVSLSASILARGELLLVSTYECVGTWCASMGGDTTCECLVTWGVTHCMRVFVHGEPVRVTV
jgi:hypothetical protein